jgi:hypothetical protein
MNLDHRSWNSVRSLYDLDPLENRKIDGTRDVTAEGRMEIELHCKLDRKSNY